MRVANYSHENDTPLMKSPFSGSGGRRRASQSQQTKMRPSSFLFPAASAKVHTSTARTAKSIPSQRGLQSPYQHSEDHDRATAKLQLL